MKIQMLILLLFICYVAGAQPVWSPKVRAERENSWMRDSLHLSATGLQKAYSISLNYYTEMDKTTGNDTAQQKLERRKDAALNQLLDKNQYKKYLRREQEMRLRMRTKYPART